MPGTALRGTVQNDILKEYVARGNYIFPPRPSMRLTTDLFAYCEERIPRWNTISISGYHIREAGSTAAQELAFTLANGIAYCEAAVAAGLSPDAFGARLSFFFNAHNDFFQEVAKFRAARTLWAQIMRDRFGATTREGAGAALPRPDRRLDPDRAAAREQHRARRDPGALGRLRRRAVAAHEQLRRGPRASRASMPPRSRSAPSRSSCTRPARPTRPTRSAAPTTSRRSPPSSRSSARELIERVDELGGAVAAIEAGFVQGEIEEAAYRFQTAVESRRPRRRRRQRVHPGVGPSGSSSTGVDPAGEQRQRERTARVRAERNPDGRGGRARRSSARPRPAPATSSRPLREALRARCTVGEICGALRELWGTYDGR